LQAAAAIVDSRGAAPEHRLMPTRPLSPPMLFAAVSALALSLVAAAPVPAAPVAKATGGDAAGARDRQPTVAVLYFDYSGRDPELDPLRKGLAQMLISDLSAADAVRVVERERLEAVLAEQKLAASGKIDPKTAVRVGKLLGARFLVLGSYFDVMKSMRVDARLVDVETGQIVQSIGADGKADDFLGLEQKLAAGLRDATARLAPAPVAAAATPPSHADPPPAARPRRAPPKLPKRLKTDTAVKYGQALAALDAGKKTDARALLGTVLAAQPDFELASRDLDRLMQ
jgi:curli biogenesis system outer membrane secretion channel CsgG